MNDRKFILRVAVSALVIAAVVGGILLGLWWQRDAIREGIARKHIRQGQHDLALERADTIEEESLRQAVYEAVADSLFAGEQYTRAGELYRQLGGSQDPRFLQCRYALAQLQYQAGDLSGALEAFAALGGFSDSGAWQLQIRYEMATALLQRGEFARAVPDFLALGDYKDSETLALEAAMAVAGGDEAVAKEMLAAGGIAPEMLQKELDLAQRRGIYATTVVAAGAYHTVLLRPDGTVAACGDNTYGQCDTGNWTDIVQIAAGAWHTVGLKKDGTVVAVGRNTYGQCDVETWRGITQIAAGDSDTLGLTREGIPVKAGYHSYEDLLLLTDGKQIFAGDYAAAVQTSLGAVICSHESHRFQPERQILELVLGTGYYAALQSDGTCLSNLEPVTQWENTVFVAGGPQAVLGVALDGTVKGQFFRAADAVDLSPVTDACQCAAGTGHYVFVMADGSVAAYGDNSFGQCDVEALGKAK